MLSSEHDRCTYELTGAVVTCKMCRRSSQTSVSIPEDTELQEKKEERPEDDGLSPPRK